MNKAGDIQLRLAEAAELLGMAGLKITGARVVALCWEGDVYSDEDPRIQGMLDYIVSLKKTSEGLLELIERFGEDEE